MARGGYFKVNKYGYGYVLNSPEIMSACDLEGQSVASAASMDGVQFTVDTRHGATRVHTRVSSPPAKVGGEWNRDWFRVRNLHSLAIAVTSRGGKMGSFKLKPRPWRKGRRR